MKPIIGIGTDILRVEGERERAFAYLTYVESLRRAGAIPVLIPPQPENIADLVETLDGILLAGGDDCDPSLYGEDVHTNAAVMDPRRQSNEVELARIARERGLPTLGICLGVQVMNVAAGGSLVQDIDSQLETEIQHASVPEDRARHDVMVAEGTKLADILPELELNVNSTHHQAIQRIGDGLRVTAHAPDGIVEGVEDPRLPFYLGVQWHPEDMAGEPSASSLFAAFVEAARKYAEEKKEVASNELRVASDVS